MSSTKRREILHSQARSVVASVIQYFYLERNHMGPLLDVRKVLERVSAAYNVSKRTVLRINSQLKSAQTEEGGGTNHVEEDEEEEDDEHNINLENESAISATKKIKISTPRKTPDGPRRIGKVTGLDDFTKSAIRRHILAYYDKQEIPTLLKLKISLKNAGLFDGGTTSLNHIIKELGFVYKKFNHRRVLMEKPPVALLRCQFLRKIRNINIENVVFLDETWLNENEHKDKGWTDDSIKGTLKAPLGKGKRLIICHSCLLYTSAYTP